MLKPVTTAPPSINSQVSDDQVRLFASLCDDLVQAWGQRSHTVFRDLPEYDRLIIGAYACGFVCRDIPPRADDFEPYVQAPHRLAEADFTIIRRFVHFMMRCERHTDCGDDLGGGAIYEAIQSGCLPIISRRLTSTPEWRD
jgi:hypothetical protein